MENITVSKVINDLVRSGRYIFLPEIGTLYLDGEVVIYRGDGSGENIIDILTADYKEPQRLYENWLTRNRTVSTYRQSVDIEPLGRLVLTQACAIFMTTVGKDGIALNDDAQAAIEAALAAAAASEGEHTLEGIMAHEREQEALQQAAQQQEADKMALENEDDYIDDSDLVERSRNWRTIAIVLALVLAVVSIVSGYLFGTLKNTPHKVRVIRDTVVIESTTPDTIPAMKLVPAKKIGSYHVIAGAYREKQRAQKVQQQEIQRGYEAIMFYSPSKNLYMVSISSGDSRDSMQQVLNATPVPADSDPYWIFEQSDIEVIE